VIDESAQVTAGESIDDMVFRPLIEMEMLLLKTMKGTALAIVASWSSMTRCETSLTWIPPVVVLPVTVKLDPIRETFDPQVTNPFDMVTLPESRSQASSITRYRTLLELNDRSLWPSQLQIFSKPD
jgi:hypothetical protein